MERWEQLRRLNEVERYDPSDLVGIKEIAQALHVVPSVVTSWNARRDVIKFATPITKLGNGPIFSLSEYILGWNDWIPQRRMKAGILSKPLQEVLDVSVTRLHYQKLQKEEDN